MPKGLISHYMVYRDLKPLKMSESLQHEPYGVYGNLLVECENGEDPHLFVIAQGSGNDDKARKKNRDREYGFVKRIIRRTKRKALELEESIHYDSALAKAIGSYDSNYEIIPVILK